MKLNGDLQEKASMYNSQLVFEDVGSIGGSVQFRKSGSSPYALSLVYGDVSGTNTFHQLINNNGARNWVTPAELEDVQNSFQDGVDTLYNKCKSCGSTPSSKTPTAISNAIQSIYTNRYNSGYNAGISAASIQTRDVAASQSNFAGYNSKGLNQSVKFDPPSLAGYSIVGAYIKKIYISNTNKTFGSGTFEILKSGNSYYIISKDCYWPGGGTSVNATMTFIYQK